MDFDKWSVKNILYWWYYLNNSRIKNITITTLYNPEIGKKIKTLFNSDIPPMVDFKKMEYSLWREKWITLIKKRLELVNLKESNQFSIKSPKPSDLIKPSLTKTVIKKQFPVSLSNALIEEISKKIVPILEKEKRYITALMAPNASSKWHHVIINLTELDKALLPTINKIKLKISYGLGLKQRSSTLWKEGDTLWIKCEMGPNADLKAFANLIIQLCKEAFQKADI